MTVRRCARETQSGVVRFEFTPIFRLSCAYAGRGRIGDWRREFCAFAEFRLLCCYVIIMVFFFTWWGVSMPASGFRFAVLFALLLSAHYCRYVIFQVYIINITKHYLESSDEENVKPFLIPLTYRVKNHTNRIRIIILALLL